jgi:hypothetical protein
MMTSLKPWEILPKRPQPGNTIPAFVKKLIARFDLGLPEALFYDPLQHADCAEFIEAK